MLSSKPKTLMVFAGCALWLAVLGWIDYATGYELGLFAFYTAPVAVVAWNLGSGPGIIVAFIASVSLSSLKTGPTAGLPVNDLPSRW